MATEFSNRRGWSFPKGEMGGELVMGYAVCSAHPRNTGCFWSKVTNNLRSLPYFRGLGVFNYEIFPCFLVLVVSLGSMTYLEISILPVLVL